MKALRTGICMLGLALGAVDASAGDFSFTGNFADDNEVQPFTFTVDDASAVIILRTLSWGGGTSAGGSVVSAGGFDPIITVFDALDGQALWENDDGNPHTGDSELRIQLWEGDYVVTLTQYDNYIGGFYLSDGFTTTGTVGFDGRSPHWAIDILNVAHAASGDSYVAAIPEPETYAMLLAGLGLLGWKHRSGARKQV
ncbi:DVUA0089 family protein [Nitrosovibrio sp. Nv17]|jgi:hypothetical protein|uniref:DVUA0089 family protein n=1 Tax=Nitrosovibrio sp. Nv17 TaxID=1855339 RepID=UPI000908AD20|nr:DVUA0089 family protein [Nitrosovibrio sp. Nv17]SFW27826.1 PEP-CTERM protein-sorting domain-containing protein [Nitrosovibrio sp. Nv17]